MRVEAITDIIAKSMPTIAESYIRISGEDLIGMPERWVQCKLADALHEKNGCRVKLEVDVDKLRVDSLSRGRGGKVDLACYDADDLSNPQCVIEVKCNRSTWPSVAADALRIREILTGNHAIEFGLLAYVSGDGHPRENVDRERQKMLQYAQVKPADEVPISPHDSSFHSGCCWFGQILVFRRET